MFGWIFDIDPLTRIFPDQIAMQFVTAFSFFLCSISLRNIDYALKGESEGSLLILPATTMITLLITMTVLAAGIFEVHTGITDLFISGNSPLINTVPGMPAIPTLISFTLFCIASLFVIYGSSNLKQKIIYLGIPIILIGLIAIFGYILKMPTLYYNYSAGASPIALNTAVVFVLLGSGLMLSGNNQKNNENKS
jgi:hypothetical protein